MIRPWHPPRALEPEPDDWLLGLIPVWTVDTSKGLHMAPGTTWRPQKFEPWPGRPLHPDAQKGDE